MKINLLLKLLSGPGDSAKHCTTAKILEELFKCVNLNLNGNMSDLTHN